jgi:hypothetical protein
MNREPYELDSERMVEAYLSRHEEPLSEHRLVPEPRTLASSRAVMAKRALFRKEVRT